MGQKVNPIGLRVGVNKDWEANWFAEKKDFAKYLKTLSFLSKAAL